MKKRAGNRKWIVSLAAAGAAAAVLPVPGTCAETARKPNVVVILSDDHGYAEISSQGCKDVKTPHIDSLGTNGIRFTSGYTSCPVCSPTRAGLMTGRYQQRFGHDHNPGKALDERNWGLPLNQKTIAQRLKEQGYVTGIIGKWHLGERPEYQPLKRGFDEYFGFLGGMHTYLRPGIGFNRLQRNGVFVEQEMEYLTDALGREAVSFIDRHKEKPFFLYLAFNAVHSPMEPPPGSVKKAADNEKGKRRKFAAMLKSMDDNIGKVLTKIRDAGLEKDTLIFFMGDNGGPTPGNTSSNLPFKGYKGQVHEGGIRVPFLAQWKGHFPAGKVDDRPVLSLDITATALAAAGGTVPAEMDGVNLIPFLEGKDSGTPHKSLFWRYGKDSAVRNGNWKLSVREGVGSRLYDLSKDPGEKKDLSGEQPERVKELKAEWDRWNADNVKPLWPAVQPGPWEEQNW